MSNKVYSEETLSRLISIVNRHIEEPEVRKELVSKFHQEIGNLITGAHPKCDIEMNQEQLKSLKAALLRWRKEKSNSTDLVLR